MSECVIRMEMPKACWSCGLRFVCKAAYDFMTTRAPAAGCSVLKVGMEGCLIVCQLPEGHGRLVDKDEMLKKIENYHRYMTVGRESDPRCIIEDSPTIVPAERSETEQI